MANEKPMFDRKETAGIPSSVVEALTASVQAAQKFGSASGRKAPLSECNALMEEQKEHLAQLLACLRTEFARRYEAGLETGRE